MKSSFAIILVLSLLTVSLCFNTHKSRSKSKSKVVALGNLHSFAQGIGEALIGIQNNANITTCIPKVWDIVRSDIEVTRGEIEDETKVQLGLIFKDMTELNKMMLSRGQDHYVFCTRSKRNFLSTWLKRTLTDEKRINFITKSEKALTVAKDKKSLNMKTKSGKKAAPKQPVLAAAKPSNITKRQYFDGLHEDGAFVSWKQFPVLNAVSTLSHLRAHLSEFLGSDINIELNDFLKCVQAKSPTSETSLSIGRYLKNVHGIVTSMHEFMVEILDAMCKRHYIFDFITHLARAFREKGQELQWLLFGKAVGQFILSIGAGNVLI